MFKKRARGRIREVYEVISSKPGQGWTRKQIADALGLSKTPYLYGLLEQLVEQGLVCKQWVDGEGEHEFYPPRYMYYAAGDAVTTNEKP